MGSIHVVGIGLEGAAGLSPAGVALIDGAAIVLGSPRHLALFPHPHQEQWVLGDIAASLDRLSHWHQSEASAWDSSASPAPPYAVVLTSGDPLFFGLGRLLLTTLPPTCLTFHPHLSSLQLAFSRLKLPWQDAHCLSVHGRSLEPLIPLLQRGEPKLAILTDPLHSPGAIAQLILDLDLPQGYQCWVCENLGGADECLTEGPPGDIVGRSFAALSVVVLLKTPDSAQGTEQDPPVWPLLGIPDGAFHCFPDRPGLMTKREVRVQILGELALQPPQVLWDLGAGTGSVAVEVGRLCPDSAIYAVEQTAAGVGLIQRNGDRFGVGNLTVIQAKAPAGLGDLPDPHRIFIGGSGGQLASILDQCGQRLQPQGRMVLALATLEHQALVQSWLQQSAVGQGYTAQWRSLHLARSASFAQLTRYVPLNPVTLVTLVHA
ncbi:precorrin-6y C5,15-methyltransferase (decarboxylating) subunit CbiE [Prochlorothrix hollandica]|uniref:precorrin-6y C5,15-methyltransferase (decarboxylating) subunit CbiE n=1 Tax=Prochlorothrix hollandica TaxID=1223 RepID=UPI00333EB054